MAPLTIPSPPSGRGQGEGAKRPAAAIYHILPLRRGDLEALFVYNELKEDQNGEDLVYGRKNILFKIIVLRAGSHRHPWLSRRCDWPEAPLRPIAALARQSALQELQNNDSMTAARSPGAGHLIPGHLVLVNVGDRPKPRLGSGNQGYCPGQGQPGLVGSQLIEQPSEGSGIIYSDGYHHQLPRRRKLH